VSCSPDIHLQIRRYLAVTHGVRTTSTLCPCFTEQEEEDEMLRNDDPLALWPEDWADNAPWRSFASHVDPVGQCAAMLHGLISFTLPEPFLSECLCRYGVFICLLKDGIFAEV